MAREEKADILYERANKKVASFDWFGFNKERKHEDAADLYMKAAAQYKILKHYARAGECYEKAGQNNTSAGNHLEAMGNYREAGKCWRHADPEKAVECYKIAIEHYLDNDRFSTAAKLHEEIGDIYGEENRLEESISAYEEAASCFETENDQTSANKRLLIVARMSANIGDFARSIKIFEKVAKYSVDNNLLRWSVKTYLYKCSLCQLCYAAQKDDFTIARVAFEKYQDMSELFVSARECQFINDILAAVEATDIERFKDVCTEFDNIQTIDKWATNLLSIVQNYIRTKQVSAPNLMGPDDEPAPAPPAVGSDPFEAKVTEDAPDLL